MLKYKGDITNIKLIDFGLAKDFSEHNAMQTPSGSVNYIFNYNTLYYSPITLLQKYLVHRIMRSAIYGQ